MNPRVWLHYTRNGPRRMTCRHCGKTISTNALARAAHDRGDECRRRQLERQKKRETR